MKYHVRGGRCGVKMIDERKVVVAILAVIFAYINFVARRPKLVGLLT